jgi:hypothetical protein
VLRFTNRLTPESLKNLSDSFRNDSHLSRIPSGLALDLFFELSICRAHFGFTILLGPIFAIPYQVLPLLLLKVAILREV